MWTIEDDEAFIWGKNNVYISDEVLEKFHEAVKDMPEPPELPF